MKIILLALIISTVFLSGCRDNMATTNVDSDDELNNSVVTNVNGDNEPDDTVNTNEVSDMGKIEFIEIEGTDVDWSSFPLDSRIDPKEIEIPVDAKFISSKEDAIRIGEAIIENLRNKRSWYSNYVLLEVKHYLVENIWCFYYAIDERDKDAWDRSDGDDFHIVIDGDNCEIIIAWVGE